MIKLFYKIIEKKHNKRLYNMMKIIQIKIIK